MGESMPNGTEDHLSIVPSKLKNYAAYSTLFNGAGCLSNPDIIKCLRLTAHDNFIAF